MATKVGDLLINITADISGVSKNLMKMSSQMMKAGQTMTMTGDVLTNKISKPILGVGISALKTAADFETSMNRVSALTGATTKQFNSLEKQAKDLGATTQFSASEAADAMGFLAMAGFKADEILGAMPDTLNLAAAAQMDLARTADIVSNILTGYGLEVEQLAHANDVLVKAMTSANVDLSMLGESMKYVGPIATAMGLQFEEVTAAIGMMGNAGIQGSMAGTAIRGALSRLSKPTDAVAELMKKLGMNVMGANGQIKPLVEIVRQLETSGATAADMLEIFGDRAGPGMAALVSQGSKELQRFTKDLEGSAGTADKIAKVQMSGLNGSIKALKSAIEGLAISVAQSGLLQSITGIVKKVTEFAQSLNTANPQVFKIITSVALLLAGLGPLLIILGTVASGIGVVAGALAALVNPVTLVIAGIVALGMKFGWFDGIVEKVTETTKKFINAIKQGKSPLDALKSTFDSINIDLSFFDKFVQGFNAIKAVVSGSGTEIRQTMATLFGDEKALQITNFVLKVRQTFDSIKKVVTNFGTLIMETFRGLDFSEVVPKLLQLRDKFFELLEALKPIGIIVGAIMLSAFAALGGVINGVINALPSLIDLFIQVASNFITLVTIIVKLVTGDFSGAFSSMWELVKGIFNSIVIQFKILLNFAIGFAKGFIKVFADLYHILVGGSIVPDMVNEILSWFDNMFVNGIKLVTNLLKGMVEKFTSIKESVSSIMSDIAGIIGDKVDQAYTWGKNMIGEFIGGMKSKAKALADGASFMAGIISDFIGIFSPSKKGPLSLSDQWMPNMVKMFKSDLMKGASDLQPQLNSMFQMNPYDNSNLLQPTYSGINSIVVKEELDITGQIDVKGVNNRDELIEATQIISEDIEIGQDRLSKNVSFRRMFA